MRLALAMGRTVRELEESMGSDEWDDWVKFHSLYDLPDGFLVTANVCTLVSQGLGGKGAAANFAPYYAAPERRGLTQDQSAFLSFVKLHGRRDRGGQPK